MSQIDKKNQEFVKTNMNDSSNADNHEFGYWKSLKDISTDNDYERYLKQSEHNVDNGISRRNFLSLIAASVALAGLEGCKKPVQKIIPYVEAEIGTIPGIPKYYASTLPFKNNALGVVIENHDERPVKVEGNDNEMFLDDDGAGNVRRYFLQSGIRTYIDSTQGTVDYTSGAITINSLNIASISNIRGASSTIIEVTITPLSNDVVPVRDQILNIDTANSSITVESDSFVGGSADAGVGYTTSSSY